MRNGEKEDYRRPSGKMMRLKTQPEQICIINIAGSETLQNFQIPKLGLPTSRIKSWSCQTLVIEAGQFGLHSRPLHSKPLIFQRYAFVPYMLNLDTAHFPE
jgi:hypothetical protein